MHPVGKRLEHLHARLERCPLVNYHTQPQLSSDLELLPEQLNLPCLERLVLSLRAAARARQPVMVDPNLADGHHLGLLGQALQFSAHIVRCRHAVVGMPADRGEHTVEPLGQVDCTLAALEVGGDGDDPRDPGVRRPLHHPGQFVGEIGKIQMSVCVVKFRHGLAKRLDKRSPTSYPQTNRLSFVFKFSQQML